MIVVVNKWSCDLLKKKEEGFKLGAKFKFESEMNNAIKLFFSKVEHKVTFLATHPRPAIHEIDAKTLPSFPLVIFENSFMWNKEEKIYI